MKTQIRFAAFQCFGLGYDKTILFIPEAVQIPLKPKFIDKYVMHAVLLLVIKIGWMTVERKSF